MQVFTQHLFPQDWAKIQNNLGNAYCNRIYGDKAQNLESAIRYYKQVLQVRSIQDFPEEWATTQNNLGTAYRDKGQIDEAIEQLKSALKVYTHTAFPIMCVNSASNLANMTFKAELWPEAMQGYSIAIEAVETSRTWAKSELRHQEILEESINVYQKMVQACINAGQIDKAFEYSERSRSKLLVDLMASYNLSQGEEIPPKVQELLQQYEELQRKIEQERQRHKSENNRLVRAGGLRLCSREFYSPWL